ncbi:WbqC family protein [Sporomusa sp. KB1]|uniref:WbqC family protein n=1 Tax=Sporomusa sp. KB1 TaxID=943346 RepID=UPI0011A89752|nr:WbqC family protein [Sporomusa sp. KB1]TWH46542.1 WbqC-like protein [Sporomusa sp. KB1]
MIISGHQPNYLPWLGYFHKMMSCDLFVILDDVLISRREVTKKNKIKGPEGERLLSVQISRKKGLIKDTVIQNDFPWYSNHWGSLETCYARSPYWQKYKNLFSPIYKNPGELLIDLNLRLIQVIREILEINTPMIRSSEIPGIEGTKGERILSLCKQCKADIYLSGNGARTYNDEAAFARNNIRLVYQEFEHPVYSQVWGDFISNLSAVDLIFNCGPNSKDYLTKQVIL